MKKHRLYLILFSAFSYVQSIAQTNTFPSSGNVGIMVNSTPTATMHIGSASGNLHYGNNGLLIKFSSGDRALMELHDPNGQNRTVLQSLSDATYLISLELKPLLLQSEGGNVGVGTRTPGEKLDVNGNIRCTGFVFPTNASAGKVLTSDASGNATWQTASASAAWAFNGSTVSSLKSFGTVDNYDLPVITNNTERMRILAGGGIVIGTNSLPASDAKLAVKGNIYSQKVKVTQSGWADYVFYKGYRLRPLSEVEQYIKLHKHLPEVPSALEVEKDGIDLGDNQTTLLKKIEELTLYVIDLNKKCEQQKMEIRLLKKELIQLESKTK